MQKENSFFFFISALGDEGDAFGTKWRKNERTRNLLSLALSKKFATLSQSYEDVSRTYI